jgi:tetraacyldisaccharide 4'-kinase
VQGDRRLVWQERMAPWLVPASLIYGAIQRSRRWAYGNGVFSCVRLDRPVVSVGSLLAGGTGKTPLTVFLARLWTARRVAVLSRGYGGSYSGELLVTPQTPTDLAGDEPVLLARSCPADVWVAHDRAQLALRLADRYDLFILDDGYQHLALERFLNICVLPHELPGRLLPAGLWREGPGALRAADLVVALDAWPDWIDDYYEGPRVVIRLERAPWCNALGHSHPSGPVFAFCGVARPKRFLRSLGDLVVTGSATWPDHHSYSESDLLQLQASARKSGATALVTTAKDAVRIGARRLDMPLFWCDVNVTVSQGEADFRAFLDDLIN